MGSITLSVKFLETQIEFGIDSPEKYTLDNLWANVYMYTCSTIPEPNEAFKADVRMSWTRKYVHVKDDNQLQEPVTNSSSYLNKAIHPPNDHSTNFVYFSNDDEDINGVTSKDSGVELSCDDEGYVPCEGGLWPAGETDGIDENVDVDAYTQVADNNDDSDLEDDHKSNATYFNWDNDILGDVLNENEASGVKRHGKEPKFHVFPPGNYPHTWCTFTIPKAFSQFSSTKCKNDDEKDEQEVGTTNKWNGVLPPSVSKKAADRQGKTHFLTVYCAGDTEYEVKEGSQASIVNLETHSCDCGLSELSGIPYKHALSVIFGKRLSVY
ncbi:hypothetical protein Ddye_009527 [Dipteronia dyeriana]|uniref:Zinc finger PMZ-type domain-containing protein n=1 Tax=Dipteronia dyeriana TaxID=168575 RepID=A0AAD9XBJ6_9ROSI|nr:hypothetical protein Ddye_009527 [Dipteronia dyeriana]